MAIDKAIDSVKLDNALTATADAIREKTGDTADIAFDYSGETGFADAVEAIETGGGSLPSIMSAYADTEWTAAGLVNSQYCAIPHGLGVRPDYIEFIPVPTTPGSYDSIAWDIWNWGFYENGTAVPNYNMGWKQHFSGTNQRWEAPVRAPIPSSASHHLYADNSYFYIYSNQLISSGYMVNGITYRVIAYQLNIPANKRGAYEYTTDPTV